MSKELFDQAIGDVPPSTVDLDAVVGRERRMIWVRRVANPWTAAGAGVAAIAVGAAVVLVPGAPAGNTVAPGAGGTPSAPPPSQSHCLVPTITSPPVKEKTTDAMRRLTGVLTNAVHERLPDTELRKNSQMQYPRGTQHGAFEFFHVFSAVIDHGEDGCSGGEDYFSAGATTVTAGKKGNVTAVIGRLGGNASPATECSPPPESAQGSCDRKVGPRGEIIVSVEFSFAGGPTVYDMNVTKPDGTGIILEAQNVAENAKLGGAPETPAPPLSLEQLKEIALDPGLTLYP